MEYRLKSDDLIKTLHQWGRFIKKDLHLIACGGTALTLLGLKESTKDVDFMVPDLEEYKYLAKVLNEIGYKASGFSWRQENDLFIWDIFPGKRIHTTELLESPLQEGHNIFYKKIGKVYIGILNYYDLICSKLIRGKTVDYEDCGVLMNAKSKEIDIEKLKRHYQELISYDVSEDLIKENVERLLEKLEKDKK